MTHRFHPLFGRDFEFVTYRQNWGEDRVHLHDANGELFSLPAGWTEVRTVLADGTSVTAAAAAFGYSRQTYYQAVAALAEAGLDGLVAAKPGPRGGHKLTDEVLAWAEQQLDAAPDLKPAALVEVIEQQFGVRVHPRSIERALARRREHSKSR